MVANTHKINNFSRSIVVHLHPNLTPTAMYIPIILFFSNDIIIMMFHFSYPKIEISLSVSKHRENSPT